MTRKVLWEVVRAAATRAGIEKLAPHDLRRSCAMLCHLAGGELDQIQFVLLSSKSSTDNISLYSPQAAGDYPLMGSFLNFYRNFALPQSGGTVSHPGDVERGCLLELGQPFLADGDEVILKGYAESPRASRIGFGAGAGAIV